MHAKELRVLHVGAQACTLIRKRRTGAIHCASVACCTRAARVAIEHQLCSCSAAVCSCTAAQLNCAQATQLAWLTSCCARGLRSDAPAAQLAGDSLCVARGVRCVTRQWAAGRLERIASHLWQLCAISTKMCLLCHLECGMVCNDGLTLYSIA